MISKRNIALGLVGLGLLGGCSGGGNTALTTVPTAHLAITLPTTAVSADAPFTFTVKALDAMGAVVTTYTGTVHITTSDPAAKLPADATLAQGVGTFTVTFNTTGNQTITASDTVGDASSGSSSAVSVKPIGVPTIASMSPATTVFGSAGFTLIVNGSNFVLTSVVQWNGSNRSTAFVSSTQVTAQIAAADIATAGAATVTVFNPAPGGGSSNSSTFTITTGGGGDDPQSIAVDPSGKFVYVLIGAGSVGWAQVSMYAIDPATGALTSIGPPVSTNGFGLYNGVVTVDPSGKFAYAVNEGDPWGYEDGAAGGVAMYTIDATTGVLTYTGSINGTGDIDGSCPGLCNPGSMVVDPSGKFAYVTTGAAGSFYGIAMYTIDATTGTLTSIGKVAASAAAIPSSVAADPAGKFVYAPTTNGTASSLGKVSMYAINATGALASTGTIAAGTDPGVVAVDPSGKFAYVTNYSSNNVSMYTIDSATGALTSVGMIAAGTNPDSVAVDPSGKFVYVTNYGSNDVSMYTIGAATGALASVGTIPAGTYPSSVAVDPAGKFVYVANSASNDISIYSIDPSTGVLTLTGMAGT